MYRLSYHNHFFCRRLCLAIVSSRLLPIPKSGLHCCLINHHNPIGVIDIIFFKFVAYLSRVHGSIFSKVFLYSMEKYKSYWERLGNYHELWLVMMFSAPWVLTFVCLCEIQTSWNHFHDLQNLAYSIRVTLSSNFKSGGYGGSKAVNGMFDDLAHTWRERYRSVRIDLADNYAIHEQEVFATGKCR